MTNRRSFLKTSGLSIAAVALPGLGIANAEHPSAAKKFKFELGVASYTLREFTQEQAIDMTRRCGVNRITFKSMHLPLDSDKATINKGVALCKEKGMELYGAGVIKIRKKADADQAFDYARAAGLKMIITDPAYEMLEYIEGKVKEYDIKMAIHNHGPGDHQLYPSGVDAYNKIKHMDKRMGLCVDIGHTKRIKRDPVKDIKQCFDRVFDIHIKDVDAAEANGKTCIVGRGVIDYPRFLKAMVDIDYSGTLALEYEAEKSDPLPGMMESFGYVKGILATL